MGIIYVYLRDTVENPGILKHAQPICVCRMSMVYRAVVLYHNIILSIQNAKNRYTHTHSC